MAPSSNKAALDFVDFVNASPTPYHAVQSAIARLKKAGFSAIRERDPWASIIKPGGKYFLTRNGSSIVAFAVGGKWRPGGPVAIVGAHTDSPCLRLKPVSRRSSVGYLQVGVETYGGGIWTSWFDRDLSVAGRVLVRQSSSSSSSSANSKDSGDDFVQRLVKVDRPLLRIPTLAIHLHRQSGFDPNKETELFPIAGLVAAELNKTKQGDQQQQQQQQQEEPDSKEGKEGKDFAPLDKMSERHHPALLDVLAEELGVDAGAIVDFELVLYDTQRACIGGLADELIFSPRLDNLGMTYCAIEGLASSASHGLDSDSTIRMAACFDHEEVGSESAQGAHSNLLPAVLRRLSGLPGSSFSSANKTDKSERANEELTEADAHERSLSRSFLVSADMAHAVHPNYAAKYESSHQPALNGGTVIKVNANQRYATNSPGIVLVQECARLAGVPLQLFVVRNDSPCGSTIGPGLAALLGVRTLDLGNPQLSMHSIRETGGAADVEHGVGLFHHFYCNYGRLEPRILVD